MHGLHRVRVRISRGNASVNGRELGGFLDTTSLIAPFALSSQVQHTEKLGIIEYMPDVASPILQYRSGTAFCWIECAETETCSLTGGRVLPCFGHVYVLPCETP